MSGARAGVTTSPAVPDSRQSVRTANTEPTGSTEVFSPGSTRVRPKFDVDVVGPCPGGSIRVTDIDVRPREVDHPSGAPSLALRLDINGVVVADIDDAVFETAHDGMTIELTEGARG